MALACNVCHREDGWHGMENKDSRWWLCTNCNNIRQTDPHREESS